jgi:hypothetical protein
MPKLKITTQARLSAIMPGAVAGGYTIERIARECGCGRKAAATALRAYQADMDRRVGLDCGQVVDEMRGAALAARRAAVARAVRSGELADTILAEGRALLDGLGCTEAGLQRIGGSGGGEDAQKPDALARIVLLDRAAGLVLRAIKATEMSWNLVRSASGLELAERLTEHKAKSKQAKDGGDVWEAEFVLLPTV